MQHSQFILPKGYVSCDLCGCIQPLSGVISYLDGQVCTAHKHQIEAQLDVEANYDAILRKQSEQE